MLNRFWQTQGNVARIGLMGGVVIIALVMAALASLLLRTDYQVLFADLAPQDSAAMVAELEKLKVPFEIGDGGTSLLVPKEDVYKTRIKLMGKELPLHGAVGFELFNNSDFGMTEFAQKINYQRALQGEITRTILSLSEIRDARVHLVLPEQGLFKQSKDKAKASITLLLKTGQALSPVQVTGIQRLVAAAVAGMSTEDVTIVDQQGVALTRNGSSEGEMTGTGAASGLDLKEDTEKYLTRKVGNVLDRTFGAGQALASVDVSLNMDQIRTTTEDVIGVPNKAGETVTGVVVRERDAARENAAPLNKVQGDTGASSNQHEVEYQVGRRVQQVVSQPGSIRRINVVAVVRQALDPVQTDQVRHVVAAAAGAVFERGDTVVVQTLAALPQMGAEVTELTDHLEESAASSERRLKPTPERSAANSPATSMNNRVVGGGLLIALVGSIVLWWLGQRRRSLPPSVPERLTQTERQAALKQVQDWMQHHSVDRSDG